MIESFFSFIIGFFTTSQVNEPALVTPTPVVIEVPEQKPTPEDSTFSFRSFLDQNFIGSDFTVGALLTNWGSHKSCYATLQMVFYDTLNINSLKIGDINLNQFSRKV